MIAIILRTNELITNNFLLPSLSKIFFSSGWMENEIWDLFGIFFSGNTHLSRILTDYGFVGHPLRKDFPLSGYKELKFGVQYKYLYYTPIELAQEYRFFTFYINKNYAE